MYKFPVNWQTEISKVEKSMGTLSGAFPYPEHIPPSSPPPLPSKPNPEPLV